MILPRLVDQKSKSHSRIYMVPLNTERTLGRNDIRYRQQRTKLIKSALDQSPITLRELKVHIH